MSESSYHLLVWAIIVILLITLILVLFRNRQKNLSSRDAQETLTELQDEYDQFRKKALEREQKLKRQLQDEINKRNA